MGTVEDGVQGNISDHGLVDVGLMKVLTLDIGGETGSIIIPLEQIPNYNAACKRNDETYQLFYLILGSERR